MKLERHTRVIVFIFLIPGLLPIRDKSVNAKWETIKMKEPQIFLGTSAFGKLEIETDLFKLNL